MGWNGMEWNGMEWNGMEWNGMEWNGMEENLPLTREPEFSKHRLILKKHKISKNINEWTYCTNLKNQSFIGQKRTDERKRQTD